MCVTIGATRRRHSGPIIRRRSRELHLFDCIEAPCVDECPVDQDVPAYMRAVSSGDVDRAVAITRADNTLPAILGRVCDHLCETTCIRTHLDEPLAIREMKRFIMSHETSSGVTAANGAAGKVAIIGAGPAGLSAGQELGRAGFDVTIFEAHPYAGGMVGGAIPEYRLPQAQIDQDLQVLADLGVEIKYNMKAGEDFTLADMRRAGLSVRLRRRRCPAAEVPRCSGRGQRRRDRRSSLPAERAGERAGPRGAPSRRHRRRRHRYGLRPLGVAGRSDGDVAHLPQNDRPDAGRPRRGQRRPGRGHSTSSSWPTRPPSTSKTAG